MNNTSKTAFIAIVGKANVGKSSILNKLIGSKIAIVSSKPQTTRTRIMGVLTTEDNIQLVFTDTPGFHKPKNKLGEKMVQAVSDSISGVDSCLFVVDANDEKLNTAELELIKKFKSEKMTVVLAINKIDMLKDKTELMKKLAELSALYDFKAIVPVSAQSGDGLDALLDELKELSVESIHFFPDDTLTDQPERVLVAEIIREKMLRLLDKEIPHGTAVAIERMRERDDGSIMDVEATIYCERESHKGIIIGKGGQMLKKISTYARQDIENFFDIKVNLQCWVKVKEDWRNREGIIHNFGLD
ncbi:MAG: GTPase Era [Ruminococcus sp.]|nr:GTPase Era [Ruminococcus sp.]MDY4909713.1 GTPase Era [Candidatus Fimenecus sp.]